MLVCSTGVSSTGVANMSKEYSCKYMVYGHRANTMAMENKIDEFSSKDIY